MVPFGENRHICRASLIAESSPKTPSTFLGFRARPLQFPGAETNQRTMGILELLISFVSFGLQFLKSPGSVFAK